MICTKVDEQQAVLFPCKCSSYVVVLDINETNQNWSSSNEKHNKTCGYFYLFFFSFFFCSDAFPHGNKLPSTNIPVSGYGPVPR